MLVCGGFKIGGFLPSRRRDRWLFFPIVAVFICVRSKEVEDGVEVDLYKMERALAVGEDMIQWACVCECNYQTDYKCHVTKKGTGLTVISKRRYVMPISSIYSTCVAGTVKYNKIRRYHAYVHDVLLIEYSLEKIAIKCTPDLDYLWTK